MISLNRFGKDLFRDTNTKLGLTIQRFVLYLSTFKVLKTCNKKRATCLAKLLQNKLNSDVARFTTPIRPVTRFLLPVFTHLKVQIIMQILADDLYSYVYGK